MLEELIPLTPAHFFAIQADCHYAKGKKLLKKHLLPDLSQFYPDPSFVEIALGWHEKGILATVFVEDTFDHPVFPDFQSGDSIEFFFDTRDVKTSSFTTRFCHHFYFLPHPLSTNGESVQAGEVTRFRLEEGHELCDAQKLIVTREKEGIISIFIPADCLYGYDPSQFDRLGFTYRINHSERVSQFFSASDVDFNIEQQPSFWASLQLKKKT